MDSNVMEQRLKQWLPIFEEQAESGLNKQDWCRQNGIKRGVVLNGRGNAGHICFPKMKPSYRPARLRLLN